VIVRAGSSDNGKVVLDREGAVDGVVDENVTLPSDGSYTLSVRTSGKGGHYSVQLIPLFACHSDAECPTDLACKPELIEEGIPSGENLCTAPEEVEPTGIQYDTRIVDTLSAAPKMFTLSGKAGWHVEFNVAAENVGGPSFVPHLVVEHSSTHAHVVDITGDVTGVARQSVVLPNDGAYVVTIGSSNGGPGAFGLDATLDLTCKSTPDCPAPLSCLPETIEEGSPTGRLVCKR
jgi:hypothetical protein